jgi:hypothetical protein
VRDDVSTDVMKRSQHKRLMSGDSSAPPNQRRKIISIVCKDRSLDFEVDEGLWGRLFHPLSVLVNHYRASSFDGSWSSKG